MDKIANYKSIIRDVTRDYVSLIRKVSQQISPHVIMDDAQGHYQFFWYGWKHDQHVFTVVFHIQLQEERVWILQDKTEEGIANLLVEHGIPKSDIVLGYFSPSHRKLTEFAAA